MSTNSSQAVARRDVLEAGNVTPRSIVSGRATSHQRSPLKGLAAVGLMCLIGLGAHASTVDAQRPTEQVNTVGRVPWRPIWY